MKKIVFLVLLVPLFTLSFKGFAQSTVYYLDKIKGDDNNNGKSKNTAWKTIYKLNSITFKAGDHICIKRGQSFDGGLYLKGAGTIGHPIILASYGTGDRPIINAAKRECAIKVMNAQYWEIADIETKGGDKAGIFLGCTKDGLELNHIRVTNCYVHDIGDTSKLDWGYSIITGGIIVVNGDFDPSGKPVLFNSVFNDVVINACTVRYNYRWTCLSISSGRKNGVMGDHNFIRNCIAEFSAADGIRMTGVRNSRIEYDVMYRNGAWPKENGGNLGGLGAWFFDADSCTIQYCEAGYINANHTDGGAFDIDYLQKNSTVQYCYGHNCAGYGVSVFGADASAPTENSTVQFNLFKNNGQNKSFVYEGDFFVFTWAGGLLNGVSIHDNISCWDPISGGPALKYDAGFTGSNPNSFTNNIIYAEYPLLDSLKNDSLKCDHNVYWVTKGSPTWRIGKNKIHSLSAWQRSTGLDAYSIFADSIIKYPSWYNADIKGKQFQKNRTLHNILPGSMVTGFEATSLNRRKVNLANFKGSPVLISFIDISNDDAIRSQLVFIRSMKRQYEGKGLKIILVDESYLTKPGNITNETQQNFINDNELQDIPVIKDNQKIKLAEKLGASFSPASYLLSQNGILIKKWENVMLPGSAAIAIEGLLKK